MAGEAARWADAVLAAHLVAIDPAACGGALVRARPGPARDAWLRLAGALLPPEVAQRRLPPAIDEERLMGGLDLAATLAAGRPVAMRGLLAEAEGGIIVAPMAERMIPALAGRLAAAMDRGGCGLIALDEGGEDDERAPDAVADRLAFRIDLEGLSARDCAVAPDQDAVARARIGWRGVAVDDELVTALCAAAAAFGIASLRAPILAVRVARLAAALAGRDAVSREDAAAAARLVLAPRATRMPAAPEEEAEPEQPDRREPPPPDSAPEQDDEPERDVPRDLSDLVVAAMAAAIPPDLLDALTRGAKRRAGAAGRRGALARAVRHGRPKGERPGWPRGGARLALVATLRAAAPWQRLRTGGAPGRLAIRKDDLRVQRLESRSTTTTIFVVDGSGSSALGRLAEAKGAVELLLAESYRRRDEVAMIAFRGRGAEMLLPPTRSLTRARRRLAAMPGGGGTPLAAGLDGAGELARLVARKGATPILVVLTDGHANVARDGAGGRARAGEDARAAARLLRAEGRAVLMIDTGARPQGAFAQLAAEAGATYLPLPRADSGAVARAARSLAGT